MLTNKYNIKPIYKSVDKEDTEVFIPKLKQKPKFDIKETWYYKLAQTLPRSERH